MLSTIRRLALVLVLVAQPAIAQQIPRDSSVADSVRRALFTRRDAWLAGGFVVATAAIAPLDAGITEEMRDPGPQRSRALSDAAATFNWLGDPGTIIVSLGVYGAGRLARSGRVAELGLRSAEALVVSAAATGALKGVIGRQRPFVAAGDAEDFHLGGGFRGGGGTSFPSGHSTAAFAVASVLADESARWWPRARFVPYLAYGGATAVGLARIYSDKHWASDVVAGAAIGTLSGLSVVRWHRLHPHSLLDRWLLPTAVAPVGTHGLRVGWVVRGS